MQGAYSDHQRTSRCLDPPSPDPQHRGTARYFGVPAKEKDLDMEQKIAIVVMGSDPEASAPHSRGRMAHALSTTQALMDAGADVKLLFEGAGVMWLKRFHLRDDKFVQHYGDRFDAVRPAIAGAFDFCSRVRFKVAEHCEALNVPVVGGDKQHSTLLPLLADGYQVITM